MKFFLEETKAGEAGAAGGNAPGPDVAKLIENSMKGLGDQLAKLNQRVDKMATPAPAPKPKAKEENMADLILVDPQKAVNIITNQVEEAVSSRVNAESAAKDLFNNKFLDLQTDYPEIGSQSSELHIRAKEILAESATKGWDANALERAVLKAASEKGIVPMKHRKQADNDDDEGGEYLGGGSSGSRRREGRNSRSEKLPAATLAFAEAVGMNTKDAKVVERLTKTHNDRKNNWSKYR